MSALGVEVPRGVDGVSWSKEPPRLWKPFELSWDCALDRTALPLSPEFVLFNAGPLCLSGVSTPPAPPFSLSFRLLEERRTSRRSLSLSDSRRRSATVPPWKFCPSGGLPVMGSVSAVHPLSLSGVKTMLAGPRDEGRVVLLVIRSGLTLTVTSPEGSDRNQSERAFILASCRW